MWSEKKIVDHYQLQARDGFGRNAIEEMARTNKCEVAEIVEILQKNGCAKNFYERKNDMNAKPLTAEQKAEIKKRIDLGYKRKEIAQALAVTLSQVDNYLYGSLKKETPEVSEAADTGKTKNEVNPNKKIKAMTL